MPITSEEIRLYQRYDGDLDGLSRSADYDELKEAQWRILEDLRQRAVIVARGSASEAFRQAFESELAFHLADAEALAAFRQIIAVDLSRPTSTQAE